MNRNELILKAAIDAGKAIAAITPSHATRIDKAGRGNFVTLADKTSEQHIFALIRAHFPSDTVLSEETESAYAHTELRSKDHLWIIDPIDGTANYQHQRNYSCVSIGYAENGVLKLGVVYDPFREELYTAERGMGALHNGQKMHVSSTKQLHNCTIITDNSYDPALVRLHLETILKISETPWILMKGSAALELCEVANGQADLFFHFVLNPWDNAAGFLILEESGGVIVDRQGKQVDFLSPIVIAGNPAIVQEFVKATT